MVHQFSKLLVPKWCVLFDKLVGQSLYTGYIGCKTVCCVCRESVRERGEKKGVALDGDKAVS